MRRRIRMRRIPCPSMRNPSGGAPCALIARCMLTHVSIDEKPVRRCARSRGIDASWRSACPSMRNPSGGAPVDVERVMAAVDWCPSMRNPSGGAPHCDCDARHSADCVHR